MKLKKVLCLLIVIMLLMTAFVACAGKTDVQGSTASQSAEVSKSTDGTTSEATDEKPVYKKMKVGIGLWAVGGAAQYALEQGFFEEAGLDVELIGFENGALVNEAFGAKEIDAACTGIATVYALANDQVIACSELANTGGMGIFVRPDSPVLETKGYVADKPDVYGTPDTLKGLDVLCMVGTAHQYNVIRWCNTIGIETTELNMVHMENGPSLQAFLAGEGDAISIGPPWTTTLEREGMVMVCKFEDVSPPINDVFAVRKDIAEDYRPEVVEFLKQYFRAADILMGDDQLRKEFMMGWYASNGREYTEEDMLAEMQVRYFLSKEYFTQEGYEFGAGLLAMGQFYADDGKIEQDLMPNITLNYSPDYIEEALGITITKWY